MVVREMFLLTTFPKSGRVNRPSRLISWMLRPVRADQSVSRGQL